MRNTLFTSEEQKQERLAICRACEFYVEATQSCGTFLGKKLAKLQGGDLVQLEGRKKKVRLCGCYLPVKANLKMSSCSLPKPYKKWDATITKKDIAAIKKMLGNESPTKEWMQEMFTTYNQTFTRQEPISSLNCGSCIRRMIEQLKELVNDN